ncbi:MAG TPA: hypothetical protein VGC58_00670 [Candidatus Paceibacterota bacterium]
MNNYLIGGVVAVLLIGGGIAYSVMKDSEPIDTGTTKIPSEVVKDDTVTPGPKSALPIATTNSTVSPSDTTAIVNGTINPQGAFTSYWYEYGVNSNLGTKTGNQTMGSGFTAIQAPGYITNLTKNTTYYFRLVAENQHGRVAGNQFTFKTTEGSPAPVGSAPSTKTVSASGVTRTTANLNGEVNPNKNMTQYWFEYGKSPELGSVTALSAVGNGNNKLSASVSLSNLQPLTTYYFRLNAQNQFGTINGSILNFKTSGPATTSVNIKVN